MASLTVRQLDDKLKRLLRLRAARHGRSMEDEVRVILRQAAAETAREALSLINPPNPPEEEPARQRPTGPPLPLRPVGGALR
ncbi:MAG: bifunctional phosphopantothenoylcysteine decarboxylase/phosphopantothenate synthase, partial [Xanthobacteraceae bacterium]